MEEQKTTKKVNWDRTIYLIVLAGLVAYFGWLGLYNLMFINANGHVLFEKISVRIPADVKMQEWFAQEGQYIREGDTLFSYVDRRSADLANKEILVSHSGNLNWFTKESVNVRKQIALNDLERGSIDAEINSLETKVLKLQNEIALDLAPRSRLSALHNVLSDKKVKVQKLKSENGFLYSYLNRIENDEPTPPDQGTQVSSDFGKQYYIAPMAGTVTKVYKEEHEIALKTEPIMMLQKMNDVYVKAFFDQEYLKYLAEGDLVTITYPDGTKSGGVIGRFYPSTFRQSAEFQNRHEPVQRTLGVDIYPTNERELEKWRVFYKMGVKITKSKW